MAADSFDSIINTRLKAPKMSTESNIQELFSTMQDSEFKEKVVNILYDLIGRIRDLESQVSHLAMKDH